MCVCYAGLLLMVEKTCNAACQWRREKIWNVLFSHGVVPYDVGWGGFGMFGFDLV